MHVHLHLNKSIMLIIVVYDCKLCMGQFPVREHVFAKLKKSAMSMSGHCRFLVTGETLVCVLLLFKVIFFSFMCHFDVVKALTWLSLAHRNG